MKLYNKETNEYIDKNVFGECEKTLNILSQGKIFEISSNDGGKSFFIGEMCDEWYAEDLTVDMCKDLSELFGKLADYLENKEAI